MTINQPVNGKLIVVLCAIYFLTVAATVPSTFAAEQNSEKGVVSLADAMKSYGPYCGLRAVYAALRYEDAPIQFDSLLKTDYLGSSSGSSLAELQRAVTDLGYHAMPVDQISPEFIRNLSHPLILHVKKDFNSKSYDHYVVCLRSVGDSVRVFDPPDPIQTMSYQEILARSDGIGLLVSRDAGLEAGLIRSNHQRLAIVGAIAFLICAGAARLASARDVRLDVSGPLKRLLQSARQAGLLAIVAVSIGLTANVVRSDGLLAPGTASHLAVPDVPAEIVDANRLQRLLQDGDTVVVDARIPQDFLAGHIPGAVNIPVDSTDAERREALRAIPLNTPVAVYCQSDGCHYADLVTAGLRADGHTRLLIYRAGWRDWNATQNAVASR